MFLLDAIVCVYDCGSKVTGSGVTAALQEMVKSGTLPFVFDSQLPTRFGVLPRYAKNEDDIRWFEVPAVMMFHVANAWQEGNTIRLSSCCFDQV